MISYLLYGFVPLLLFALIDYFSKNLRTAANPPIHADSRTDGDPRTASAFARPRDTSRGERTVQLVCSGNLPQRGMERLHRNTSEPAGMGTGESLRNVQSHNVLRDWSAGLSVRCRITI